MLVASVGAGEGPVLPSRSLRHEQGKWGRFGGTGVAQEVADSSREQRCGGKAGESLTSGWPPTLMGPAPLPKGLPFPQNQARLCPKAPLAALSPAHPDGEEQR